MGVMRLLVFVGLVVGHCTVATVALVASVWRRSERKVHQTITSNRSNKLITRLRESQQNGELAATARSGNELARRSVLQLATSCLSLSTISHMAVEPAYAAVGSLVEFADSNAILQGITVDVADPSQQDAMVKFLLDGFDFKILRQERRGSVTNVWLGFGPEQLSIPDDFTIPVSSFALYGGHASINVRYDADLTASLYQPGDPTPGDNIAYLQVGVPTYRISQLVRNSGRVLDAYGYVNVVSPSGLPIRGIIGIRPDPMMFIAINCQDVKTSQRFYEQLGFVPQEYPYARPSKGAGPFEPAQPEGSVYVSLSRNCMGLLLLRPTDKKKAMSRNPAVRSLNIVYTPADEPGSKIAEVVDPSGVGITFQPAADFQNELQRTSS